MQLQKVISIKSRIKIILVAILKVTDGNSRIRSWIRIQIRIRQSEVRIHGSGSVPKYHGFAKLLLNIHFKCIPEVLTGHKYFALSLGQLSGHLFPDAAGGPGYHKHLPRHRLLYSWTFRLASVPDPENVKHGLITIQTPVLRIRDVYPGSRILIFTHPGSRTSAPGSRIQKQQQKRGVKKNLMSYFFMLPQI